MCASSSDPSVQECKLNELAIICQCANRKRLVSRNAQNDPNSQVIKSRKKKKQCANIKSKN